MLRTIALLLLALSVSSAAQNPKSVTFLRLGAEIVSQRLQTPPAKGWGTTLRQQYRKAGIQPDQLSEQAVPGSSQPMLICTLKGRAESLILVTASLDAPQSEAERNVAWASLAMLPLLAESLNSVSTGSTVLLIAFPPANHRASTSRRYAESLSKTERAQIKAAVEISGVGRGATSYDVKHEDRYLSDWLVVAAASLRQAVPTRSESFDTQEFADARAFRSASIPAITVSSPPQRHASAWNWPGVPVQAIDTAAYYATYQELCVFLIDIDRAAPGESPRNSAAVVSSSDTPGPKSPQFTDDQAGAMVVRQIDEVRDQYQAGTLSLAVLPELHNLVCQMAGNGQLDAAPFDALLNKKKLSGTVVVASDDYPRLTPEQLQGLKVARYHRLSVATCVIPSDEQHPTMYWIAALAY